MDAQSSFSGWHLTGGIVGRGSGTITNCTNHATVKGTNRVGGIAGRFEGTISGCTNNGKVTCTDHTGMPSGGIVGFMSTNVANKILNCTNNGEVTGNNGYIGGIVGDMQPNATAFSIIGCTNTGKVTSTYNQGGFAGGIIGGLYQARSNGMIYGCINKGSIAASSYAGGILGYNYDAKDAYIVACGNLSAPLSATYNGGIAGAVKENADYIIGSWSVKAEGEEDTPICGYKPSSTSPISSYIFADNTTAAITAEAIAAMNTAIATNKSDCTYQWSWTSGSWPTLSSSTGD